MPPLSRFTEKASTDSDGLREQVDLPYNLQPREVLRTVEDIHDLLHEVNSMLVGKGYDRMEELLDRAGFSGFVSRTVVDRLDRLSRQLVQNGYHNGYPDLVPRGAYAGDKIQHGDKGGLEVKASRNAASWESHGPRGGWFCIVQFEIDRDESKALQDREPTRVLAVMIAELDKDDWKWQPAGEGKIRSGTASIKPSGAAKLRANSPWVDPAYAGEHDARLFRAKRDAWRKGDAEGDCLAVLVAGNGVMSAQDVADEVASKIDVPADQIKSSVQTALKKLVEAGAVTKPKPGAYEVA
jgi:hypothetical protein